MKRRTRSPQDARVGASAAISIMSAQKRRTRFPQDARVPLFVQSMAGLASIRLERWPQGSILVLAFRVRA